jgi:hypothetical protein
MILINFTEDMIEKEIRWKTCFYRIKSSKTEDFQRGL